MLYLLINIGSEERINANAEAYEELKQVAALSSPPSANASPGVSTENIDTILSKVHKAKDKHIFRCKFLLYIYLKFSRILLILYLAVIHF